MAIDTNQVGYWDEESAVDNYFDRQLGSLKKLAVDKMIDAALDKLKIYPKRVLEIGGGSQFVSRYLCEKFPDAQIVCTDVSKVRINESNKYYGSTPKNLIAMGGVDARSLPFPDEEFDLIIGDAMLHHIDFLKPALFEINRCLSRDGAAVFVREPIVGWLGLILYRAFQLMGRDKKHMEINYFEYKRMLSQWHYEFIMAGFKVRNLKWWRNQGLYWKLRSLFPHITPSYIGFILIPHTRLPEFSSEVRLKEDASIST